MDSNYWLIIVISVALIADKIRTYSVALRENKQSMTNF